MRSSDKKILFGLIFVFAIVFIIGYFLANYKINYNPRVCTRYENYCYEHSCRPMMVGKIMTQSCHDEEYPCNDTRANSISKRCVEYRTE